MSIFLLCFVLQFSTQYKDFVHSPQSVSILNRLTRGEYHISEFADNPVVLWFWRTHSGDPETDSLLYKIPMRKNFYLSAVLRWEAREASNYETASNKLLLATHFDNSVLENFLSFIVLAIKYRNLDHFETAISLPVFADFRNQVFLITNLVLLFFFAIIISGVIYTLVKTIYYLPVLSHRIDPQGHNKIKGLIPFLLLLTPIIVFRNLYLIVICYSLLLAFVLSTREKNWLRIHIIVFLLFSLAPLPLGHFISFLQHRNRSFQLYEMVKYDSDNVVSTNTDKEKELLAYALRQHGKVEEALRLYEDLYHRDYRNAAVLNNLANIYFQMNRVDLAETLYRSAIRSQARGEIYFNLGLLKLKNIEYSESSYFMDEAKKRNFSSLSNDPIDIEPGNDDFMQITMSETSTYAGIVKRIYFFPILIIFLITFLPVPFEPPFHCNTCGQPICEECLKKIDTEIICNDCFTKFKSAKSGEMESSLRAMVMRQRQRLDKFITYLLNIVIPGAGVIYQGKNFKGFIFVFFVMLGYAPLLFPRLFIKPAGWISLSLSPIFIIIALFIAALSYIYSFAYIRRIYAGRR
jgi:tetratricopeptide (TPR) repeat protein